MRKSRACFLRFLFCCESFYALRIFTAMALSEEPFAVRLRPSRNRNVRRTQWTAPSDVRRSSCFRCWLVWIAFSWLCSVYVVWIKGAWFLLEWLPKEILTKSTHQTFLTPFQSCGVLADLLITLSEIFETQRETEVLWRAIADWNGRPHVNNPFSCPVPRLAE